MPSTFASAAAGNAADSSARRTSGRSESGTFGEWGRRPNGATQTFRRPSLATNTSAHASTNQREGTHNITSPTANSGAYVPPHISASRNGTLGVDMRYSREQLLDLFRAQKSNDELEDDVSDLFVGDWDRYSKRDDSIDAAIGPEVCLEHSSLNEPLGLFQMNAEEREIFSTSVNSQLKAPNQPGQRDGQHRDISGARKMSFTQGHGTGNVSSPLSARPFGRRRDTGESYSLSKDALASPSTSKFGRDDPFSGPANPLVRRRTDLKDPPIDRGPSEGLRETEDEGSNSPFGLPRRISSGPLSAGLAGPTSPWASSGLGNLGAAPSQKRPGALNRSESRFKNLMSRDNVENATGLGTLSEDETRRQTTGQRSASEESDHFRMQSRPVGSAALGGANDEYAPENARGQDFPAAQQQLRDEPSSPTYTNPYQSPERNMSKLHEYGDDDLKVNDLHLPGLGGLRNDPSLGGFSAGPGLRGSSAFDARSLDRNQGPLSGTQRGFSGLGGLGTLPATSGTGQWPTALGSATPSREHAFSGFGETSGLGEGHSGQAFPGLGGLGSYGAEGFNDGSRGLSGSRLGSLFPSGMHDQMSGHDAPPFLERSRGVYDPFSASMNETGEPLMSAFHRETDSPLGQGQGRVMESMRRDEKFADSAADLPPLRRQQYSSEDFAASNADQVQRRSSNEQELPAGQPPAAQQKTMVMPDRIRWIYRDPQGNTQGPWSGLEMHDWYRAGFFSPELLVKKVEDPDYEPLAQLIRRIGNSREPFLVPQIGIPGPPSASGTWPTQPAPPAAPASATTPSAQPPFASSFPSFGTTLTAEQQNALERRKQEEQYLMARQKEHLAQQQVLAKQRSIPGSAGLQNISQQQSLQHHSSAHSLQSQPSFGSMAAQAGGFSAGGATSGNRGFPSSLDTGVRGGPGVGAGGSGLDSLGMSQDDDAERILSRLDIGHPGPTAFEGARHTHEHHAFNESEEDDERIANMLGDRARLQQEQAAAEKSMRDQHGGFGRDSDRLRQFHDLQRDQQEHPRIYDDPSESAAYHSNDTIHRPQRSSEKAPPREHKLTLTEQVQKAASAKQSPSSATQSPWANKVDKPIAESHPTSGTSSPLPAPAARRNGRQSVADALAAETSKPSSPAVDTPSASLAPWASQTVEGSQKQPSLKEIQQAEARRAAKRDEEQAALRRAALERDLANQPIAPAPGLPSSSTWASGETVTSPSMNAPSAWVKATTKTVATPGGSKKTLQQIQKEEEAMAKKQKAAAAAAAAIHGNVASGTSSAAQAVAAGKRYADLASRTTAPMSNASSAWTTVGASGKTKTPTTPAPPAALQRTATGSIVNSVPTSAAAKKPPPGPIRTNSSTNALTAYDDFKRWAVGELRSDLNKGVDAQDLVTTLLDFPADKDLITETVHSASNTIDSRHFAEEFVKRRALADKGKAQPPINPSSATVSSQPSGNSKSGGGGWSEVARKGPAPAAPKEDPAFKIVATKKKGAKR